MSPTDDFYLHRETYGSGKEPLLAFHGFYRDAMDFMVLLPSLGGKYTIHSFDLFHHGKSRISNMGKPLEKEKLKELITLFLRESGIESFSLLGYSLGGLTAMACIEFFPGRVKDVYLFAPYGLKKNRWIDLAEQIPFSESIFRKVIGDPSIIFKLFALMNKTGIASDSMYRFILHQLETKERRQKIYDTWKTFRNIRADIRKIREAVNRNNINLHLFYGSSDPIEPPVKANVLICGLKNKNVLHILDTGHNLINEKTNEELRKYIL